LPKSHKISKCRRRLACPLPARQRIRIPFRTAACSLLSNGHLFTSAQLFAPCSAMDTYSPSAQLFDPCSATDTYSLPHSCLIPAQQRILIPLRTAVCSLLSNGYLFPSAQLFDPCSATDTYSPPHSCLLPAQQRILIPLRTAVCSLPSNGYLFPSAQLFASCSAMDTYSPPHSCLLPVEHLLTAWLLRSLGAFRSPPVCTWLALPRTSSCLCVSRPPTVLYKMFDAIFEC
jgi:hypothetical protein